MKSDEPEQTDFVWLGRYAPREAAKLLARFEEAGIPFRMQPRKPSPEPGPTAGIYISVDATRGSEVPEIHRDLFGDGLPNYDSSFFRDHNNV
jgi:hypothetical protein